MFIGSSGKYKEYSLENFLISVIVPVYGYYYESMVTKIYSYNVDIVFACMKSMNQNKIWINKNKNQVVDKFHEKVRLFRNGSVCDKKKRLFEENEISFIKGRYFEDNIVLLQLAFFSKKLATDDAVSYNYFFNPHSICRKSSEKEKRNKDKLFMTETIVDYFSRYNVSVREKMEIFFFLTRAFIANWLEVTNPFYSRMIKLFGKWFVFEYKMKSFCHKVFYGKLPKVLKMFKYIYLYMKGDWSSICNDYRKLFQFPLNCGGGCFEL